MRYINKRSVLIGLVSLALALFVFQAGIFVGYHKALFSYRGENRYFAAIEGQGGRGGMMMGFSDEFSPNHGAIGQIISVSLPSFVVAGPNNAEKTVVIDGRTTIRRFRDIATSTDIRADDFAVVLGEPDQSGAIQARFVRLMPAPAAPVAPSQK